jgi:hypothetical protein
MFSGANFGCDFTCAFGLRLGNADPFDGGKTDRDFAPEHADPASADKWPNRSAGSCGLASFLPTMAVRIKISNTVNEPRPPTAKLRSAMVCISKVNCHVGVGHGI